MNRAELTSLLVLAFLTGCKGAGTARPGASPAAESSRVSDVEIEKKLVILDPVAEASASGRVLTLRLENTSVDSLEVRCSVDWLDHTGARLALAPIEWVRVTLEAKGSKPVRFQNMPTEARSWRLRFQRG